MERFYVIAGRVRYVPALPERGALRLAEDLVELVYEQALVVDEMGAVRYLVSREYAN
jgi:hypothetical protein